MELPNLINKIESLRRELAALGQLPTERREKLDKKFRLEFNYNSNHIEGNTLTYGETELYLIFDKTTGNHDGREYEEMKASDVALKIIQDFAADKERPLTEAFIRSLNKTILVRPYWTPAITQDGQQTQRQIMPGDYKKHPNSVRLQSGEMFHYALPEETPLLMNDLLQWYHDESAKNELHPVALAALLHYKFVRIHPFDDGNGRISRLLMNYVLYSYHLPPVIIKSANKREYLFALNRADSGDLDAFAAYIAQQMIWSLELSIKAAKGEDIEEHGDVEKEIAIWKKELKSKNPIDAIHKTPEIVQTLYSENFGRFFHWFNERLSSSFRDLFIGWNVYGMINRVTEFHIGFTISSVHPSSQNIDSILLQADISGLKSNSKKDVSLTVIMEIFFNDDNYSLSVATPFGTKTYLEGGRKYDQRITKDEQQTIISDTIKDIFAYIKQHTEVTF